MFTNINTSIADRLARRKDGENGFTLIELLVVVIIIGILAAIAIPVFLNQRQSAWKASVASDLRNAAAVVETYATSHNGSYTGYADVTGTPTEIKETGNNSITVTIPTGGNSYSIIGSSPNIPGQSLSYGSATGGLASAWVG